MNLATSEEDVDTLLDASDEYTEGEDVPQLTAVHFIWRALRNITFKKNATKDTLSRYQSIALFDTGIDVISRLKSVPADDAFASKTTKRRILYFRKYSKCKL